MSLLLPGAAGWAAGLIGGGLVSSAAHSIYGGVFKPAEIHGAQAYLWESPISIPDPATLIRMVNMGLLANETIYGFLQRQHGNLCPEDNGPAPKQPALWQPMKEAEWDLRKQSWEAAREIDRPIMAIQHAAQLFASQRIDLRTFKDRVIRNGGRPEDWEDLVKLSYEWPNVAMALAYWIRGLIDDKCLDRLMDFERIPTSDCSDIREVIRHSAHDIMGPADLVRFAVKDAWDDNIARALGYDEPFPPEFRQWMRKQGLAWPFNSEPNLQTTSKVADWAQLTWRAHWENVSPTQLYEMGHRLRAGRVPADLITPVKSGDPTQFSVDLGLKIADYPSEARKRMVAITYRIPSRSDIGTAYKVKAMDRGQVKRALQDVGYDPTPRSDGDPSALEQMTELVVRQADQQRLKDPIGQSRSRIERAYEDGAVSRDEAATLLQSLVFDTNEATLILNMVDLLVRQRGMREVVRGIRRNYLLGEYDRREAEQALQAARVASDRIPDYLNRWQWQLHVRYRYGSAASLSTWLYRGFTAEGEVRFRLKRIGYTQDDISRIIAEVRRKQSVDQTREAERLIREAEKARREAERARQQIVAGLMRHSSPAKMKPRYLSGLMTEAEVRDIMQLIGWTQEAIDDELNLWNGERP